MKNVSAFLDWKSAKNLSQDNLSVIGGNIMYSIMDCFIFVSTYSYHRLVKAFKMYLYEKLVYYS